jgi:outer membrane protein, multidrug efflux system
MWRRPLSFPAAVSFPSIAVVALSSLLASPAPVQAKAYSLAELVALARRSNPGLAANAQATAKVQAQLSEANRSWMPTGEVTSMVAPVPELKCEAFPVLPDKTSLVNPITGLPVQGEQYCIRTNISETSTRFSGVFTRTELRLTQPLYTFGKLSAGRAAARQGLEASRSRDVGQAADVELNVKKAYFGLKAARLALEALAEGSDKLAEAEKHIKDELAKGTGDVTQTDRLRMATVRAELDIRIAEAQKVADDAHAGLRALMGPEAPADLDVDADPLEPTNVPQRPLSHYEEQARLFRPEVRALDNLVASKRALSDLERRKQYPDLVVIGSVSYSYASSIDNPQNAYLNDPFNTRTPAFGGALALRLPIDIGVRNARAAQVLAEAEESVQRRREALGGIAYEVQKAYAALTEAQKRLEAVRRGERSAKAWITAVSANFATGLAETRDFTDALVQSFQFRIRAFQAVFDLNVAAATLSRVTGGEVAAAPAAPADKE